LRITPHAVIAADAMVWWWLMGTWFRQIRNLDCSVQIVITWPVCPISSEAVAHEKRTKISIDNSLVTGMHP
jgi:hypothetical protein